MRPPVETINRPAKKRIAYVCCQKYRPGSKADFEASVPLACSVCTVFIICSAKSIVIF